MAPDPAIVVALDHIAHPPDIAPPPPEGLSDTPTPVEATTSTDTYGGATKKLDPLNLPHEPQDPVASTSATDIDGDAPKKTGLFDLPVELQDAIFDYAYPPNANLAIATKSYWNDREYRRRLVSETYQTRAFPESKVSEFLVSKEFFVAASQAWLRNQWVNADCVPYMTWAERATSLFIKAPNVVVPTPRSFDYLTRSFTYIKKINLRIGPGDFKDLAPRLASEDVYDDREITSSMAYNEASRIRGLISFEVQNRSDDVFFRSERSQQSIKAWAKNLVRFEQLLKAKIMTLPDPLASERDEELVGIAQTETASEMGGVGGEDGLEEDKDESTYNWADIEIVVWRVLGITAACLWLANVWAQ